MTEGIVSIVFGKEYEEFAIKSIAYSRAYYSGHWQIITNIPKNQLEPKWTEIKNLDFLHVKDVQDNNRFYKTKLPEYTFYDKTIYMDVDAIIKKDGIDSYFDVLDNYSIFLNFNLLLLSYSTSPNHYREAIKVLNAEYPLSIFYGACIGVNKTKKDSAALFDSWYKNWVLTKKGRDMASLACAVQHTSCSIFVFTDNTLFGWADSVNSIIQHEHYKNKISLALGIKNFKPFKPFDVGKENQWKIN